MPAPTVIASLPPQPAPSVQPTVATVSPPRGPTDEQRITELLSQYRSAYERMDPAGVNRLHPAVSESQLSTVFGQYRSYAMTIDNPKISIAGDTATVVCTINATIRPRVGDVQTLNRETTFRLRKARDQWTIVERR